MFKIKPLRPDSKLPVKVYQGDAGFDVFSHDENDYTLYPGDWRRFGLGFAMELQHGWVALIQEKSGLAFNNGIITYGNVIDSGYRGEVHAQLLCHCNSPHPFVVKKHMKIAQMIILPCYTGTSYVVAHELSESNRGEKGFGSSGLVV